MSKWTKVDSTFIIDKKIHPNLTKDNILEEIFEKVLEYEDIPMLEQAGIFYNDEFNKNAKYLPYGDEGSIKPVSVEETDISIIIYIYGNLRDSHFSIGEILDWYDKKISKLGCRGSITIKDGRNYVIVNTEPI